MYYIKKQNKLVELHSQIREAFPNVSFPEILTDDLLAEFEVYQLVPVEVTYDPSTQKKVLKDPVIVAGKWTEVWEVTDMTTEEINNYRKSQVPQVVFMRQARLALLEVNLLDNVEGIINTLPEPFKSEAKIEWEYATDVRRDWPTLNQIAEYLELTEDYIDDLFILAASK